MGKFYPKWKNYISGAQHHIYSAPYMLRAFSWYQIARQIKCPYYTSIASSVQTEKASKNILPIELPAWRKKIGTGKSKVLADAVVEEVDILCGLLSSNEKEWNEIVDMKQEIASMKLEKAARS